jgi:glucosamine-6-phosphate deaminase
VGRNGHIGFNEPGAREYRHTRVALLDASTQAANNVEFERGATLGLDTLACARVSILVLRGIEKRSAAELLLYGPDQPSNPSAHLRRSGSVSVYVDTGAAPDACLAAAEIGKKHRD